MPNQKLANQRLVTFADNHISISHEGHHAAKIVKFLYRWVGDHDPVSGSPCCQYRLKSDPENTLSLYRNNTLFHHSLTEVAMAECLLGDSCYQLVAHSRGGVVFHAAGLKKGEAGIILAGASGAGKSTLTAWLLKQGFEYLTDELVFVPLGSDRFRGFCRPLNLKSPSRTALAPYLNFSHIQPHILSNSHTDLIPAPIIRPDNTATEALLTYLIFPRYTPESKFSYRRLSKAQAGLALMETLVNARNLPGHGFAEATRIAKQTAAYRLDYGCFEQLVVWLQEIWDTDSR